MSELITSAYDGPKLTVSEMMEDPTFIPQRVVDGLQGQFLEDLFFRQAEDNKGVVAFREAAGLYLADDAEEIAEFGEIPVSAPELGALKAAYGIKTGEAIRISYEMRNENKVDQVNRHIQALEKTVIRHGINAVLGVFEAAQVPELQASGNRHWAPRRAPHRLLRVPGGSPGPPPRPSARSWRSAAADRPSACRRVYGWSGWPWRAPGIMLKQ